MSGCVWLVYSAHERVFCSISTYAYVKILLISVPEVSSEGEKVLIGTLRCSYSDGVGENGGCNYNNTNCILLCVLVAGGYVPQAAYIRPPKQKIVFFG